MSHGSLSVELQCGAGYEGERCGRCVDDYSEDLGKRCIPCSALAAIMASNATGSKEGDRVLDKIQPFLVVGGVLLVLCAFVAAYVWYLKKKNGGTLAGGYSRAVDLFVYATVLFQTTLLVSNDATPKVMDAIDGSVYSVEFVKDFYEGMSAFQLDFSFAVKPACLSKEPWYFEKLYLAVMFMILLWWCVQTFFFNRSAWRARAKARVHGELAAFGQNFSKVEDGGGTPDISEIVAMTPRPTRKLRLLTVFHQKFTTLVMVTYAVTCKVSLSVLHCNGLPLPLSGKEPIEGEECTAPPSVGHLAAVMLVIHCFIFPIATFISAHWVRRRFMGGKACCIDDPATHASQYENKRTPQEVALWRWFVHSDILNRYFWIRHCNMVLLFLLVSAHIVMDPPIKDPYTGVPLTAEETRGAKLARSFVQIVALFAYIFLLVLFRPYVRIRQRVWKLYVSIFNKTTALVVITARMLAEQQDASVTTDEMGTAVGGGKAVSGMTMGALVLLYLACIMCVVQFFVLLFAFGWSLSEGAKAERKRIIIEQEEDEEENHNRSRIVQLADLHGADLESVDNPMRSPNMDSRLAKAHSEQSFHCSVSSRSPSVQPKEPSVVEEEEEEDGGWLKHYDEGSNRHFWHHEESGESQWIEEEEGEAGAAAEGEYDYDEGGGEDPSAEDQLASVRAQLYNVLCGDDEGGGENLVNEAHGDWCEVRNNTRERMRTKGKRGQQRWLGELPVGSVRDGNRNPSCSLHTCVL